MIAFKFILRKKNSEKVPYPWKSGRECCVKVLEIRKVVEPAAEWHKLGERPSITIKHIYLHQRCDSLLKRIILIDLDHYCKVNDNLCHGNLILIVEPHW